MKRDEDNRIQCVSCEDFFRERDMLPFHEGGPICNFCHEEEYILCWMCGKEFKKDTAPKICPGCGVDPKHEE